MIFLSIWDLYILILSLISLKVFFKHSIGFIGFDILSLSLVSEKTLLLISTFSKFVFILFVSELLLNSSFVLSSSVLSSSVLSSSFLSSSFLSSSLVSGKTLLLISTFLNLCLYYLFYYLILYK